MPPFERMDRHQVVTLWANAGPTDDYGRTKVRAPVEITVRIFWRHSEAVDANGNTIALDATMITGQKVGIGSIIYPESTDVYQGTGSGSAYAAVELYEVKTYNEWHDLKDRLIRREVGLARYKAELPEIV